MTKIPGLGEMYEGILEIDPLAETYQIRCLDDRGTQRVVDLNEVLSEYAGRGVRLTVGFLDALQAAADRANADVEAVTLEDLRKS